MQEIERYINESAEELYNNPYCGYFTALPDGIIVKINDTLLQWLQRERAEVLGIMRWQDFLTMGGKMYYETHFAPMLQMYGVVKEVNMDIVSKTGAKMPMLINAVQVKDSEGNVLLSRSVVIDMTERKQYERELLLAKKYAEDLNERLAEANRQLNELIQMAVHDLKNPLHGLRMAHEMLQSMNGVSAEADRLGLLNGNMAAIDRMTALITNLLQLNELEQGAIHSHPEVLDVRHLLEGVVQDYRLRAEAKHITLKTSSNADTVIWRLDSELFEQVLDNLLSNAIKYSPLGGVVVVRLASDSSKLRIEIQDEGVGVSPEDMKKLFGKFVRLSARPTGGEHSTGLGLSIVKKMVEAMNGKVWCESENGKGATFIVELPQRESHSLPA